MNKKEIIINAALKLFVAYGFHGTATAKIAQEAGVANGTLFQHFKTKDELILAIYIHLKTELADKIQTDTARKSGVKATMQAQFICSVTWAIDNSTKFNFIQQFLASPYINQVNPAILEQQVLPHLAIIEQGVKENVLKALPTDFIYMLITSQTFGLYQYIISKKQTKAIYSKTIKDTFDMFWAMIT